MIMVPYANVKGIFILSSYVYIYKKNACLFFRMRIIIWIFTAPLEHLNTLTNTPLKSYWY